MFKAILITHQIVVTIFFLIYVVKTVLLLSNKQDLLQTFTKTIKLPEIIVSALFLITGVFLLTQLPVITTMMWIKIALVFASIPVAVVGFKKGNKGLATLSLLMIMASYALAEINHKHQPVAAPALSSATAGESADGKSLYEANCSLCHGSDGKLGMAGALDLSKSELDVASIKQVIISGRGAMPAAQVSNEQASAIADYVSESIKGK